jgi:hypothetical protein
VVIIGLLYRRLEVELDVGVGFKIKILLEKFSNPINILSCFKALNTRSFS